MTTPLPSSATTAPALAGADATVIAITLESIKSHLDNLADNDKVFLAKLTGLADDMSDMKTTVAVMQESNKRVEMLEGDMKVMREDMAALKMAEAVRKGERGVTLGLLGHPAVIAVLMAMLLLALAVFAKFGVIGK